MSEHNLDDLPSRGADPLALRQQTFIKIRYLTAMPYTFVGLKVAIALAVIGAVIGEFVGVGGRRRLSHSGVDLEPRTPRAFAALVLLTIISIVLYYGIAFIERIAV